MESREGIEQTAAAWIAKRDMGPWNESDAAVLEAWLAESVAHRVAYYRLNAAWEESGRLRAMGGAIVATAATPPIDEPAAGGVRKQRRKIFALAASVLVASIAATTVGYLWPWGSTYRTSVGGLTAVPLEDGSRITLNTDSELRVKLASTERRIELGHGEAFFEVAKDPKRPFVVHAGNKRVIAVGTQFSVRRDRDDVRVVVTEGTVRIETDAAEPVATRLLSAGASARSGAADMLVQKKSTVEIEQTLSWRNGTLTFRDTPLADAVAEFNRYNTRKIVIQDPSIAAIQVGGIFRPTNVDLFVHLLEDGFPVQAAEEADRIILTSK